VAGYELALDPDASTDTGPRTYWGVADADQALKRLLDAGGVLDEPVRDVGDAIRVAAVRDPAGSIIAIIENPHFQLPDAPSTTGPGR
jgi:predicted enzyme related to lactoylglutathione lyase